MHELLELHRTAAIGECQRLSFAEKGRGLWEQEEIVEAWRSLPEIDDSISQLTRTVSALVEGNNAKILVLGGATGRLGRSIARENPNSVVVDIDNAWQMVISAKQFAHEEEPSGRRHALVYGSVCQLPFAERAFDCVVAHGLFRYFEPNEQVELVEEAMRVGRGTLIVAEGQALETIKGLQYLPKWNSQLQKTEVTMCRLSLFYMLLKRYKANHDFRILVDEESINGKTQIEFLMELAGTRNGTLHELIIQKRTNL